MQSYNENELLKTNIGDLEKLTDAIKNDDDIKGATHHVIGKIPKKDSIVKVNGLEYKVVNSNPHRGMFVAKILKPEG